MSIAGRLLLPWLLPLLVCWVVGRYSLLGLHRILVSPQDEPTGPIGAAGFLSLAILFGLRINTLLLQILGKLGLGFRFSLCIVLALAIAASVGLAGAWRNRRKGEGRGGLEGAIESRGALADLEAAAVAFSLLLLYCGLFSYVDGWDVFTHWLVVPNEILSFDRMAYAYGTTRSVAASYPVHQVALGAVASLLSGHRDAIANVFSGLFLLFASLAILEASWLVACSRLLAGLALLTILAVTGTQEVVFGYFYGDALVIAGVAFSLLGVAYQTKHRGRGSVVVIWASLTMPCMTKGLGLYLSLLGGALFMLHGLSSRCGCRGAKITRWKGFLVLSALFLMEIILPKLFAIGVRSNEWPPGALGPSQSPSLAMLFARVKGNTLGNEILLALFLLAVFVPVFSLLHWRRLRGASQRGVVCFYSLYGLVLWGLLTTVTIYVPTSKSSWPRYATMLGPAIAMLVVTGMTNLRKLRRPIAIAFLAAAMFVLIRFDYRGYVVAYARWPGADLAGFPRRNEDYFSKKSFYDEVKRDVDGVGGRIFYLLQDNDFLAAYKLGLHFAMAGIRAPLLSRIPTCPADQVALATKVEDWILGRHLAGSPPPELRPITDFIYFGKPFVKNGRSWVGLVRLERLLASR